LVYADNVNILGEKYHMERHTQTLKMLLRGCSKIKVYVHVLLPDCMTNHYIEVTKKCDELQMSGNDGNKSKWGD
jgi:hypothetical protein